MVVNPWEENLNSSSCESDREKGDVEDHAFQRRESNGVVYESRYFKDEDGNLCEEVVRYRSVIRRTRCNQSARDRISLMKPFGKELKAGTKAGQSLRTPEVMDWVRDKATTITANDREEDYALSCYGAAVDMSNPFRRKANLLEDLFKKLLEETLLKTEDIHKSVATTGRPGSAAAARTEPRRMMGGSQEERTIRVSNLTEDITETHLQGLFKSMESNPRKPIKIEKCYIPKDDTTGLSRGFAFVTFAEAKYAKMAIEKMNRHNFVNVVLSVEMAKPPKARSEGSTRLPVR